MARVGILTTPDASERNMEHLVFQIGRILEKENEVDLVGLSRCSERIRKHFSIFVPRKENGIITCIPLLGVILRRIVLLQSYVRRRNPDVIMAISGIGVNGLSTALVGMMTGTPSVVRITSDIFLVQKHTRPMRKRIKLILSNNVLGRVAILLATKTIVLHDVQVTQLVRSGFSEGNFFVVPQPIIFPPLDEKKGLRKKIRANHGIPQDAYLIGVIGRLDQDKRLRLLCDVIRILVANDRRLFVLIIGDGKEKHRLQSQLRERRIIFVGQVERDQLASYYKSIDVVLHTSYSEGLSSVIAEALYCKVPVVASDSGAITRELVSNIGRSAEEIASIILNHRVKTDTLPTNLKPVVNSGLYLQLIRELIGCENRSE